MKLSAVRIIFIIFFPCWCYAQTSRTIKLEKLSRPANTLPILPYEDILQKLIHASSGFSEYEIKARNLNLPYNIVARSEMKSNLVYYKTHPFLNGMLEAYAHHRPFVLSPDMVWLLINQGFANHVNANSEKLRNRFVNFDGKLSLVVRNDAINLENPNAPWTKVFPEFNGQIAKYTGKELINCLTSNFSTTTSASRVASEITVMEAMKSYFEYIVIMVGCGIPEITLEGTTEDWQNVYAKAQVLRKYECEWWIDELDPVLKEFIDASQGKTKKSFWKDMFIYDCDKKRMCGAGFTINGWITKFFPYNKEGKRTSLKEITKIDQLPPEVVKVDLKHLEINAGNIKETPLELWAGFTGLKQNEKTFALKPEIGWMIRKKDPTNIALEEMVKPDKYGYLDIRVQNVPKELLQLNNIKNLTIRFTDEIKIPDEMSHIKIEVLNLYGKISEAESLRVRHLFPEAIVRINTL